VSLNPPVPHNEFDEFETRHPEEPAKQASRRIDGHQPGRASFETPLRGSSSDKGEAFVRG